MSRDRGWLLLAVALASACAAQHDEPTGAAFDGEAKSVDAPAEPTMEAEAAPGDSGELDLAAYQRELAANEARLRELGVMLPPDVNTLAGGDAAPAPVENAKESKRDKPSRNDRKSAGSGAGGLVSPSTRPGTAPSADVGGAKSVQGDRSEDKGRGKGKDKDSKKKAEDADDGFAPPPPAPDPAKAAPLTPNQSPELDAATRCQQVCELGQITCELSVQICELADRHAGEDDYLNACERASEDCTAAQEACDACEAR